MSIKKKVGRPRTGKEIKKVCSIRIETKVKKKIIFKFGSVQKFINRILNEIKW